MKFLIHNYKKDEIMSTAGESILKGAQDALAHLRGDKTKGRAHIIRTLAPLHPGKMIQGNLEEMKLSVPKAASMLSVSKQHLYRVVNGSNPLTPDLAYRVGKLFGNGSKFWLNLQTQYDLFHIEQAYMTDPEKIHIADNISRCV